MRIAFLTTSLFDTPRNGSELCTLRLLRQLASLGHELHLIGRGPAVAPPEAVSATTVGEHVLALESLPFSARARLLMHALLNRQSLVIDRFNEGGVRAKVSARLDQLGEQGDLLCIADHLQVMTWLAPTRPERPLLMMHNVESDVYAELLDSCGGGIGAAVQQWVLRRESGLLGRLEHDAMQRAAEVLCLSQRDADRLQQLAVDRFSPVMRVLPGYPQDATSLIATPSSSPRRRIGLIGTWSWRPNRLALQWFLDEVLPRLPANCEVLVAGAGCEGMAGRKGAHFLGRVPSALDFYAGTDLIAVPAVSGSGVQEKSLEAMACSPLVVASPHALRGLGDQLPPHVLSANDAESFASLCAHALPPPAALRLQQLAAWTAKRSAAYRSELATAISAAGRPPSAMNAGTAAADIWRPQPQLTGTPPRHKQ